MAFKIKNYFAIFLLLLISLNQSNEDNNVCDKNCIYTTFSQHLESVLSMKTYNASEKNNDDVVVPLVAFSELEVFNDNNNNESDNVVVLNVSSVDINQFVNSNNSSNTDDIDVQRNVLHVGNSTYRLIDDINEDCKCSLSYGLCVKILFNPLMTLIEICFLLEFFGAKFCYKAFCLMKKINPLTTSYMYGQK